MIQCKTKQWISHGNCQLCHNPLPYPSPTHARTCRNYCIDDGQNGLTTDHCFLRKIMDGQSLYPSVTFHGFPLVSFPFPLVFLHYHSTETPFLFSFPSVLNHLFLPPYLLFRLLTMESGIKSPDSCF